jgi:anthranilate synthase component II
MRLLILDNYDSFTYNLVHLVEKVSDIPFEVITNNGIGIDEINNFDKIILSPGPGLPSEAGIMPQLLEKYHATKSILGVCLGLQAIGTTFNSPLKNLDTVYHGVALPVTITKNDTLFKDCPSTFMAGRYHSWVIDEEKIDPDLLVTAVDDNKLVMAVSHKHYNVRGVQFHPESILSEYGETIIKNWLQYN